MRPTLNPSPFLPRIAWIMFSLLEETTLPHTSHASTKKLNSVKMVPTLVKRASAVWATLFLLLAIYSAVVFLMVYFCLQLFNVAFKMFIFCSNCTGFITINPLSLLCVNLLQNWSRCNFGKNEGNAESLKCVGF